MIKAYIRIARIDHWFKNAFMLPGIILGWMAVQPKDFSCTGLSIVLGVIATGIITSSNYTINELLDAPQDKLHPDKCHRPAARGEILPVLAYLQWFLLAVLGLTLAWFVNLSFFKVGVVLFVMGIIYNMKPFRTKDIPYVDVLTESINNPLRFILGWYSVNALSMPPIAVILAYWMMGAFFTSVKRLAELRNFNDAQLAASYRRSFSFYTQERLIASIVFYVTAFGVFVGIFIATFHMEMIVALPFICGLFSTYIYEGFKINSPTQYPETLYKQRELMIAAFLALMIIIISLCIQIPWLKHLIILK